MSDRYARLILQAGQFDCAKKSLEVFLRRSNLSLTYPSTSKVITWTAEGRDDSMNEAQLWSAIQNGKRISFQLWWEADRDLFCTFSPTPRFTSLEFALDGNGQEQQTAVATALFELSAAAFLADAFVAYIFDPWGATVEVPWEERLVSAINLAEPFPYTVLVSTRLPAFLNASGSDFLIVYVNARVVSLVRLAAIASIEAPS